MQRYILRGLAVAIAAIGLGACVDSLAPTASRVAAASQGYSITLGPGFDICTPCPPGLVCAAVCQVSPPEEVPEVATDTTALAGTDVTVVLSADTAAHSPTSPGGIAQR